MPSQSEVLGQVLGILPVLQALIPLRCGQCSCILVLHCLSMSKSGLHISIHFSCILPSEEGLLLHCMQMLAYCAPRTAAEEAAEWQGIFEYKEWKAASFALAVFRVLYLPVLFPEKKFISANIIPLNKIPSLKSIKGGHWNRIDKKVIVSQKIFWSFNWKLKLTAEILTGSGNWRFWKQRSEC